MKKIISTLVAIFAALTLFAQDYSWLMGDWMVDDGNLYLFRSWEGNLYIDMDEEGETIACGRVEVLDNNVLSIEWDNEYRRESSPLAIDEIRKKLVYQDGHFPITKMDGYSLPTGYRWILGKWKYGEFTINFGEGGLSVYDRNGGLYMSGSFIVNQETRRLVFHWQLFNNEYDGQGDFPFEKINLINQAGRNGVGILEKAAKDNAGEDRGKFFESMDSPTQEDEDVDYTLPDIIDVVDDTVPRRSHSPLIYVLFVLVAAAIVFAFFKAKKSISFAKLKDKAKQICQSIHPVSKTTSDTASTDSEQTTVKVNKTKHRKTAKLTAIIVAVLAVIGASVGIYAHFTSKNERKIKDTLDSLSAAGIHLTRDVYSLDDLHNIIRRINDGGDGTLSKDEFSLLSDKLQRKMIESGDVAQFYELKDMASMSNSKANTQASPSKTNNKIKTEDVNFTSPMDVWSYLSRNTFVSDNGLRVQIRRDGVYVNGNPQYASPEVVQFNSKSAVIKAFTPYGHTSTTFVIAPEYGYMETLSGEEFFSR